MSRSRWKPDKVEINGHQEYWRGWFHGWTTRDGELLAVIEREAGGTVTYIEPYKVTFTYAPDGLGNRHQN